jgi:RimJ/RimL family protein N-acetyltransferase
MSLLNYAITAATGFIGGAIYAGENLLALIRRSSPSGDRPKPAPPLRPHQVILEGQTPQGRPIRLRPMTEDDWDILLKWNNDLEVLYYAEGDDITAYSLEQVQALYRSVCQNAICFIIEAAGQPIGECWLQRMNIERVLQKYPKQDCRRIDLAIGDKQYWGQGIGTEVIRLLTEFGFLQEKADIIYEPGIADYNLRSLRAFQKAGYEIVGKVRQKPGQKANFEYDLVLTKDKFLKGLALPGSSQVEPS